MSGFLSPSGRPTGPPGHDLGVLIAMMSVIVVVAATIAVALGWLEP